MMFLIYQQKYFDRTYIPIMVHLKSDLCQTLRQLIYITMLLGDNFELIVVACVHNSITERIPPRSYFFKYIVWNQNFGFSSDLNCFPSAWELKKIVRSKCNLYLPTRHTIKGVCNKIIKYTFKNVIKQETKKFLSQQYFLFLGCWFFALHCLEILCFVNDKRFETKCTIEI